MEYTGKQFIDSGHIDFIKNVNVSCFYTCLKFSNKQKGTAYFPGFL